jgi:hypothetical protein
MAQSAYIQLARVGQKEWPKFDGELESTNPAANLAARHQALSVSQNADNHAIALGLLELENALWRLDYTAGVLSDTAKENGQQRLSYDAQAVRCEVRAVLREVDAKLSPEAKAPFRLLHRSKDDIWSPESHEKLLRWSERLRQVYEGLVCTSAFVTTKWPSLYSASA